MFMALLVSSPGASAQIQTVDDLNAGDSIRVDGVLTGRVLSNVNGMLVLVGRAAPKCTTGVHIGEAPVCDPAPSERHELDPHVVSVERWEPGRSSLFKMIGAVLVGGTGGALLGRAIGPALGLGKVDGCVNITGDLHCTNPRDDFEEAQLASDLQRGTIFGGILGATISAVVAKKLINNWVAVAPPRGDGVDSGWTVSKSIMIGGR